MLDEHLEKLKTFHVTATEGSFIRASQKLGLTQPAVTKAVRLLEESLKSSLFVRNPRGVSLTPKGRILNDFCESLFLKVRNVEQQIASNDAISGVVKIGTYETLGELFWPQALVQITKRLPGITIELTTENPDKHFEKLESGAIDIVVDSEPRSLDRFHSKILYSDKFGIFCKKKSPLLLAKTPTPIAYVKRATGRRGTTIEQHLARSPQRFDLRYSVESFTMVRALVNDGICAGVLPFRLAKRLLISGAIVPFQSNVEHETFGEHRICATCAYDLRNDVRISKITDILKLAAADC